MNDGRGNVWTTATELCDRDMGVVDGLWRPTVPENGAFFFFREKNSSNRSSLLSSLSILVAVVMSLVTCDLETAWSTRRLSASREVHEAYRGSGVCSSEIALEASFSSDSKIKDEAGIPKCDSDFVQVLPQYLEAGAIQRPKRPIADGNSKPEARTTAGITKPTRAADDRQCRVGRTRDSTTGGKQCPIS